MDDTRMNYKPMGNWLCDW